MKSNFLFPFLLVGTFFFSIWSCKGPENPKMLEGASAMAMSMPIQSAASRFPSYCQLFKPPSGVTDTFTLSQAYPDTFDVNAPMPWTAVDFKTDYKKYLTTILAYCMEGNIDVDFKVQNNKVRKWYSSPWMHDNGVGVNDSTVQNNGREYWHGLTREIKIPTKTLGTKQTTTYQTYAIAYYNAPGGYTIGKVWKNANQPNVNQSTFPEGTVTFKLLFTEADTMQVPYLANSKKWKANIFVPFDAYKERTDTDVRLLQLDVAIKDKRANDGSGWVYGTFVYDALQPGKSWVERMAPVGLMWGDDPNDMSMLNITDKINPSLKQSIINPAIVGEAGRTGNQGYVTHLGMGGRMNGPVDNPIASCISCHARAAINPQTGGTASLANFTAKKGYTEEDFKTYFTEIPCGVTQLKQIKKAKKPEEKDIELTFTTGDYSFQIINGIRNYINHLPRPAARGVKLTPIPMISRDGHVE
jgi:hypothetical protein